MASTCKGVEGPPIFGANRSIESQAGDNRAEVRRNSPFKVPNSGWLPRNRSVTMPDSSWNHRYSALGDSIPPECESNPSMVRPNSPNGPPFRKNDAHIPGVGSSNGPDGQGFSLLSPLLQSRGANSASVRPGTSSERLGISSVDSILAPYRRRLASRGRRIASAYPCIASRAGTPAPPTGATSGYRYTMLFFSAMDWQPQLREV